MDAVSRISDGVSRFVISSSVNALSIGSNYIFAWETSFLSLWRKFLVHLFRYPSPLHITFPLLYTFSLSYTWWRVIIHFAIDTSIRLQWLYFTTFLSLCYRTYWVPLMTSTSTCWSFLLGPSVAGISELPTLCENIFIYLEMDVILYSRIQQSTKDSSTAHAW